METEQLAKKLMEFKTVSPVKDPAVFKFLKEYLNEKGVDVEIHDIDGVKNLTAETGEGETSVCFNGHLDVVEPGVDWDETDPFDPKIKNGKLYGRGATDMKGGVAAEVKAFLDLHEDPEFEGSATLMLVGDEEIGGENGTKQLVEEYYSTGNGFDYVMVGEPTDMNIQVATRGLFWVDVYIQGDTVHASRVKEAETDVMEELPMALQRLKELQLDHEHEGNLPDPTLEVTSVSADDTYNSLPGEVHLQLDIRYVPEQETEYILEEIRKELQDLDVDVKVETKIDHGGAYKLTDQRFRKIVTEEVKKAEESRPDHITEGGASDGRFFAEEGTDFIELGLNQEMVHQRDEWCKVEEVRRMREAYYNTAKRLCSENQKFEEKEIVKNRI